MYSNFSITGYHVMCHMIHTRPSPVLPHEPYSSIPPFPLRKLETGIMSFDAPLPPYNASDPHASFLNSTALDLLLIEIVPLAHRLANELSVTNEPLDDEEEREAMFYRLETLGYRVGQGLVER